MFTTSKNKSKTIFWIMIVLVIFGGTILGLWTGTLVKKKWIETPLSNDTVSPMNTTDGGSQNVGAPTMLPQYPGDSASQAEKEAFGKQVKELAKEGPVVIGPDCVWVPAVVFVPLNGSVVFRNEDTEEHTLKILEKTIVFLPKESKEITTSEKFGAPNSINGFLCDNKQFGYIVIGQNE